MNIISFLSRLFSSTPAPDSQPLSRTVLFHVIGPDGPETRHVCVGEDIPEAQYNKLSDPATGALYGLTFYENGTLKTATVPKQLWDQANAQFGAIDSAGADAMGRIKDTFKDL